MLKCETVSRGVLLGTVVVLIGIYPRYAGSDTCAFVADQSLKRVLVIDAGEDRLVDTIEVPAGAAAIAINGARAYVAAGKLSVVDLAGRRVVATVDVAEGSVRLAGLAVSPDGWSVYVATETCTENTCAGRLSVIDTFSLSVTARVGLAGIPVGVAITPDGAFAYVTNRTCEAETCTSRVTVIDTAIRAVTADIDVADGGGGVDGVAIGSVFRLDGDVTRAYVNAGGIVSVIDPATNEVIETVRVGDGAWNAPPQAVAFGNDTTVYVLTNICDAEVCPGRLAVLDTQFNKLSALVPVGGWERSSPRAVAASPDGDTVYVTSGDMITIFDAYNLRVRSYVSVGGDPDGTAFAEVPGGCATPRCPGDYNRDGKVALDEILRAVNASLDDNQNDCYGADRNGDGRVTVDELLAAVNAALNGCAA
jgi:YVTN family beta-propeller protein